jgi:2-dehydro-3-deoxyphosphogluconate aldolase / (4S)-4-hydroxy-2-oxoglutarate aldolase
MQRNDVVAKIIESGVVAIIRADSSEQLVDAALALEAGGVTVMELTMTTPNALEVVRAVRAELGDRVLVGIGTVIDPETCRMALLAGAQFVVTPVMKPEIIAVCNRYAVPIVCGAYTPTEALAAQEAGADLIKIFPADSLGPGYIKAILAPLPQLRIVPTGGVDKHTAGDFIRAGCVGVAAGSSLVSKEILRRADWELLTKNAAEMIEAVRIAREGIGNRNP